MEDVYARLARLERALDRLLTGEVANPASAYVPPTYTEGGVLYANASGVPAVDTAKLFWDYTNKRLGINDDTPSYELDVNGTIQVITALRSQGSRYVHDGANYLLSGWYVPLYTPIIVWTNASPTIAGSPYNWTMASLSLPVGTKGVYVRLTSSWAANSNASFVGLSYDGNTYAVICRATGGANLLQDAFGIVPIDQTDQRLYARVGPSGANPVASTTQLQIFGYFL